MSMNPKNSYKAILRDIIRYLVRYVRYLLIQEGLRSTIVPGDALTETDDAPDDGDASGNS